MIVILCMLTGIITYLFACNTIRPSMEQSQNIYINQNDKPKVNLNTASREELKSLPSIDNKRADAIINGRPYRSIYDLRSVRGFGIETIHSLENLIECGGD